MSDCQKPITVLLAVNRLDEFLPLAIGSILNQSFSDFQFLIIANNCGDDLWEYLTEVAVNDARVELHRTKIGQLVFNLNYGINLATGKYIARMDADDIALPTRLEEQYRFMEDNPDVNVLGTNVSTIDENGTLLEIGIVRNYSDETIRKVLPFYNPLVHPALMYKAEDILKRKGYAWGFWAEDYEYHLRCRRDGDYKFSSLEKVLLHYRKSSAQMTAANNGISNYANECALMFREFLITGDFRFLYRIIRLNLFLRKCFRYSKKLLKRFAFKA